MYSKETFQKSHAAGAFILLVRKQPLATGEARTRSLLVVWQWTQFKKLRCYQYEREGEHGRFGRKSAVPATVGNILITTLQIRKMRR